ncbi:MAG: hypothetical protein WC379_12300 [Methanoregula sp.]
MGSSCSRCRCLLLATLILITFCPAGAWTFQSYTVTPSGTQFPPGTPVEANFSISFDSWMTGTTFQKDNTLLMTTNLTNPRWTVNKVEAMDSQEPIVEAIPVQQSDLVSLNSWMLSYSRKQYSLVIQLTGTTPSVPSTRNITLVRLQEMNSASKPVPGTLVKKEIGIRVPTPEPDSVPDTVAPDPSPAETPADTPDTKVPGPGQVAAVKTTYSPSPDPLLAAAMLMGLAITAGMIRRIR